MFIFTFHPLTGYLLKFRIISSDISQSGKISKNSKCKRDFYKHKSMLSAPFGSTIAPHINVSDYHDILNCSLGRKLGSINCQVWQRGIANEDAKYELVNLVENFDLVTRLKVQRSIAQIY